ncbi:MAG: hypothetical protein IGR76_04025 [Synechococcales cyanobacterium T60_A2020_003]|nr:hypothetical protein [Synechococcales cyanobacterium T60_A2020_003]
MKHPDWTVECSRRIDRPGKVWETSEPIWIERLERDFYFVRKAIAPSTHAESNGMSNSLV